MVEGEPVTTLGELYSGNLHVHVSGAKADELVYRVRYTVIEKPHGGTSGAEHAEGKERSKTSLFKRSDIERESEYLASGRALPTHYSQSTLHRSGALDAHDTVPKAPHRD